ncbi:MAG: hypothetical protein KAR06_04620 [Deltaproteobacteria bacterium]|nr:hypothetical protein [Deltaproteobacteria bacterium]
MLPSEYYEIESYPNIKHVFEKQLDMLFNDLRCMLKSPLPGCSSGYNLSITMIILNLFSGFSRRLFRPNARLVDNERYILMLEEFFPWDGETLSPTDCSEMLYGAVRNPLTHELGIKGKYKVNLIKNGRSSDNEIKELEDSLLKPTWLPQIFSNVLICQDLYEKHISITGLYWGTHRLLHKLLADTNHASRAEAGFKKIIRQAK